MIEFLKSWVLTIITLVLFLTLIEIILPSAKSKKLVSMVSGFILIITMINPVLALFGKSVEFDGINLKDGVFLDQKEIEIKSRLLDNKQTEQIIEVYRQNIAAKLRELCEAKENIIFLNAEVQLVEDPSSDSFGEILRIYLDIAETEKEQDENGRVNPIKPVRKVQIGEYKTGDMPPDSNSEIIKELEREVETYLGVHRDDIVINLIVPEK